MAVKSDIEIAQEAKMLHIREVAKKLGITEDDLEYYGKYKAKVDYRILKENVHNSFDCLVHDSIPPSSPMLFIDFSRTSSRLSITRLVSSQAAVSSASLLFPGSVRL